MKNITFSVDDYKRAIFEGTLPIRLVYPFSDLMHSPFQKKPYLCQLLIEDADLFYGDAKKTLQILENAYNIPLDKYPPVVLSCLINSYIGQKIGWVDNMNIITQFIKDGYSRIIWTAFKYSGISVLHVDTLNDAQLLWIYCNDQLDKNESFSDDFHKFEYLASVSNPEYYRAIQDYKSGNRDNIAYDSMHTGLVTGDLDTIDRI